MPEDKIKKTTCNKKSTEKVLPAPTAEVIADILGVSKSYVKKVRTGTRPDKSKAADAVKYCNELLVDGQKLLVQTVTEIMHSKQTL